MKMRERKRVTAADDQLIEGAVIAVHRQEPDLIRVGKFLLEDALGIAHGAAAETAETDQQHTRVRVDPELFLLGNQTPAVRSEERGEQIRQIVRHSDVLSFAPLPPGKPGGETLLCFVLPVAERRDYGCSLGTPCR